MSLQLDSFLRHARTLGNRELTHKIDFPLLKGLCSVTRTPSSVLFFMLP